jgi:hypothetical protein
MADPAYIVDGVLTDGEAWVAVASTALGAGAATITFTSTDDGQVGDFSQYMDLVVIGYARAAAADANALARMTFNNDTSTNYQWQELTGTGAAVAAATYNRAYIEMAYLNANSATANVFGAFVCNLFDINSGKFKSGVSQSADDRDGSGIVGTWAFTWESQAPITEIDIVNHHAGDWMAGSRFDLFGVLPRMVA